MKFMEDGGVDTVTDIGTYLFLKMAKNLALGNKICTFFFH